MNKSLILLILSVVFIATACPGEPEGTKVCTADQKRCNNNSVETCKADGSAWEISTECKGIAVCDESTFICKVCTTDQKRCNGNNVEVCKNDGSAWEVSIECKGSETCDASNFICKDGSAITWENISIPENNYKGQSLWGAVIENNIYIGNANNSQNFENFFVKYDVVNNTFTDVKKGNLCACGYNSDLVVYDDEIYYFANEGEKYSPLEDSWTVLNYPEKNQRGEAATAVLNNKLYYIGGRGPLKTTQYYDPATDSWSDAEDYLYAASESLATTYNNKIYVFGGDEKETEKKVSVYDPTTKKWNKLKDLPSKTTRGNATVYKDKIYVTTYEGVSIYDPKTDSWSLGEPEHSHEKILFIVNDLLYMIDYDENDKLVISKIKE